MRSEQEQLTLRLRQQAHRADQLGMAVAGRFLTGEERSRAVHEARQCGVEVAFDGGWPEAERVQACFYPPWAEPCFTGVWMEIRWPVRFARCEHRDLLGSLMGLGIDRAYFGDLIAREDGAWLFTLPEIARRLPLEWQKAGSVPLTVHALSEAPQIEPPRGERMRETTPSLRLDAILASGMRLSRAKAAEMIRQGLVAVDHAVEERIDRMLQEGSLLSIRGFGRIRLLTVGEPTRKDRLPIELEVFKTSSRPGNGR